MTDVERMLVKQFLLRARQEGYTIVENHPRSVASEINIDIYRGRTKICTFDDRQLGPDWNLQVRTDDSTRAEIKDDYCKLFYMFIHLRDLYMLYAAAEPLRGYDQTMDYRAIMQYNHHTLAVRGYSKLGQLEFGTFRSEPNRWGGRTIRKNIFFDMDCYPLAKLSFVTRSGLLPEEQLITPDNIKYLHGSCTKTIEREGALFDDDTRAALGKVISNLEKAQDSFREVEHLTSELSAAIPSFIEVKILGTKGAFTKHGIDPSTVPYGLFSYDVQYSSDDLRPDKLWISVLGRNFGTVITKKPMPIGEKGYTPLQEGDFTLNPEKRFTLREFQARSKAQER